MALIAKANMVDATCSAWAGAATEASLQIAQQFGFASTHAVPRLDYCERVHAVVAISNVSLVHI